VVDGTSAVQSGDDQLGVADENCMASPEIHQGLASDYQGRELRHIVRDVTQEGTMGVKLPGGAGNHRARACDRGPFLAVKLGGAIEASDKDGGVKYLTRPTPEARLEVIPRLEQP
jgi:hypothetical protein